MATSTTKPERGFEGSAMPYDKRTCAECGEPMAGPFCANCGTRAADASAGPQAGDSAHDEPTQIRAVEQEGPYRGYSQGIEDDYGRSAEPTELAEAGAGRGANRANQMLVALIALVAVAVAAMLGYLFTNHGDKGRAQTPVVSDSSGTKASSSGSSAPSASSSSSGSSSSAKDSTRPNTQDGKNDSGSGASNGGGNPDGGNAGPVVPPANEQPTTSSEPSPSTTGINDLDGLVTTTSMGGSDYGLTRSGNAVTVWQSGTDGASSVGTFTLNGGGGNSGLEFINLPGCGKPVVAWNAAGSSGSAAYGFDGSGYQAYVGSASGDMSPSGGTGAPPPAYGVNSFNGMLEMRDDPEKNKDRGQGNHFDSCASSSPDVLHMVSGG